MASNVALLYQGNKINTASPAELTLMLYEGAIKFCNKALLAMENRDILKTNENIKKAERIITELNATLDMKYPVAKDFENVYTLIHKLLFQANIKKDPETLKKALGYIREMRDTWKEVMRRNNIYVR